MAAIDQEIQDIIEKGASAEDLREKLLERQTQLRKVVAGRVLALQTELATPVDYETIGEVAVCDGCGKVTGRTQPETIATLKAQTKHWNKVLQYVNNRLAGADDVLRGVKPPNRAERHRRDKEEKKAKQQPAPVAAGSDGVSEPSE